MSEEKVQEKIQSVTPQQIEQWKQQHGEIYLLEGDDLAVYCKKPGRPVMARFVKEMQRDLYSASQNMLSACLVHPSMDALLAVAKEKPGVILSLAGELNELAGTTTSFCPRSYRPS